MDINKIQSKNIVIAMLVAVVIIIFMVSLDNIHQDQQIYDITCANRVEYVVKSGDTLDSIASEHNESNLSSYDFANILSDINGIDSVIYPGDVIYIPDINNDGEI